MAAALETRAKLHEDQLTYKILVQIPHCNAAKEWFKLKAEVVLTKLKAQQQKEQEQEEAKRQVKRAKNQGTTLFSTPSPNAFSSSVSSAAAISSSESAAMTQEGRAIKNIKIIICTRHTKVCMPKPKSVVHHCL